MSLITSGNILDNLAVMVLVINLLIISSRNLHFYIYSLAFQSMLISGVVVALAVMYHAPSLIWLAALILLVRGILFPFALRRIMNKLSVRTEATLYLNVPLSLLLSIGVIVLSYQVQHDIFPGIVNNISQQLLPVSIATLLIGFIVMITRKQAITQIIGFLVMENGIFLAALGLGVELPFIIEFGIAFDILMGILIMGLLVLKIKETFISTDTAKMRSLRG